MKPPSSPRLSLARVLAFAVLAVVALVGGRLVGRTLRTADLGLAAAPWPVIVFALWCVLLWHELGHVVGGALAGFRLTMLAVGPLRADAEPDGWRFRFNRDLRLWGGAVMSIPMVLDGLRQRMLWMTAAGPAASWLGAAAGFSLAWWVGPGQLRLVMGVFGLTSAAIGCVTLIPSSIGPIDSDGRQILRYWRGGPDAGRACALAALAALGSTGRPREWPAALVEQASAAPVGAWFRHAWHLDRNEHAEARRWLLAALDRIAEWPEASRSMLHASAVWYFSMEEPDRALADHYYGLCQGPLPPAARALVEAAHAHITGDRERALRHAQSGLDLSQTLPGSAGESFREFFRRVR